MVLIIKEDDKMTVDYREEAITKAKKKIHHFSNFFITIIVDDGWSFFIYIVYICT